MKRVVIVEDQTAVRQMLAHVLDAEAGYEVIGESGDDAANVGFEARAKIDRLAEEL